MSSLFCSSRLKLLTVFLIGIFFFGQVTTGSAQLDREVGILPLNELKINAPLILVGFVEMTYERQLNPHSGLGISAGIGFTDEYNGFSLIPHYRLYFGKRPARGFYIEGNAALYSRPRGESPRLDDPLGYGLGVALGFKLINSNRIVADVFAGMGRNFSNSGWLGEAYPRLGIGVGKKF